MAFGRNVRLTLKNRHVKFYDLISKIHQKIPKKHTPFFLGGGVGSEMNKTRQHRRDVLNVVNLVKNILSCGVIHKGNVLQPKTHHSQLAFFT